MAEGVVLAPLTGPRTGRNAGRDELLRTPACPPSYGGISTTDAEP